MKKNSLFVSVIAPFFNEGDVIERALSGMVESLENAPFDWELICVNDGSTDNGFEVANNFAASDSRIKILGYQRNRGRGYALAFGAYQSKGDILVTTEIDLSWGNDIVQRLVAKLVEEPDLNIVIASPNLPGGGYKNVPFKRIFLSKLGNQIIRRAQGSAITMYTGMTRAYTADCFKGIPIDEFGKEFHLDVAQKAMALGYSIAEISCVLEWKDKTLLRPGAKPRKSSSKISALMKTHLLFAIAAAPFRYLIPMAIGTLSLSTILVVVALINYLSDRPSLLLIVLASVFGLISISIFGFALNSFQNIKIRDEIWKVRSALPKRF